MTSFRFTPTVLTPFSFQPTLDGAQYTATVRWNLFGRRYYISLSTLDGTPVFNVPLVESPAGITLQALAWAFGKVTATALAPHGLPIGATVNLTVSGCLPVGYNGAQTVFVTGESMFTYQLMANPGALVQAGAAAYDINLAGGYFDSVMVFRNGAFEVSP